MSSSSSGHRGNAFGFWRHVAKWTMPEEEGSACGNCPTPAVAAKTPFRGPINLRTEALKKVIPGIPSSRMESSLCFGERIKHWAFYACCRCWRGKPQLCFCQDVARIKGTRASRNKRSKYAGFRSVGKKGTFSDWSYVTLLRLLYEVPLTNDIIISLMPFFPRMGH